MFLPDPILLMFANNIVHCNKMLTVSCNPVAGRNTKGLAPEEIGSFNF